MSWMMKCIEVLDYDWKSTKEIAETIGADTSDKSTMNTVSAKLRMLERDGLCESRIVLRPGARGNPTEKMWRLVQ